MEMERASAPLEEQELELIDVSRHQAKSMIREYFKAHHSQVLTYIDLFEDLRLDMPLIVELCDELEREGKIAEAKRTA